MNTTEELWSQRAKDYWSRAIRYLRLIGNSGFLFTIYLSIIVGSYYYSELLKWLPEWFPAALFLATLTAVFVTKSPLRTFLKSADVVFLSPIEGKLQAYFRFSLFYSFIVQSFVIIFVIVLLTPMYRHFIVDDASSLIFIIVVLLISKGWNLIVQWEEARLLFLGIRQAHTLMRFIVNLTLTYFLFSGASIYFIVALVIMKGLLLLLYYQHIKQRHSLKWEFLIEVEERMVMFFYRIANMFTDVPKLSTKVKQRKFWSSIPNFLTFNQTSTFPYLFLKSFIRANDYFGIYIRLTIVAIVFIFYVQFDYGRIFVALLFLYMSALQLSTLMKHHNLTLWIDLYPIDVEVRKKAFSSVVFSLLLIKVSIFTLFTFLATNLTEALFVLVLGFVFSYLYSYFYMSKTSQS
ncbi:hypothetical protein BKP45_00860 [Anaerobacillus alkalidiazotrophicus]|uniref:ABC transporter permease n=1 Tax=Anaerobacillus alkalidiazotrophicus TaxID=472963 RepID=A0A1S2M9H8_9BACI|nr:ABC transporter permease [Anaerobacillus alkalidiazotrophicus]OIJ21361.1 hypothetical protein BKP45_00860 [Anaerobacillus alkalidiazotrophicus]